MDDRRYPPQAFHRTALNGADAPIKPEFEERWSGRWTIKTIVRDVVQDCNPVIAGWMQDSRLNGGMSRQSLRHANRYQKTILAVLVFYVPGQHDMSPDIDAVSNIATLAEPNAATGETNKATKTRSLLCYGSENRKS
jgi:hypothetical protein